MALQRAIVVDRKTLKFFREYCIQNTKSAIIDSR